MVGGGAMVSCCCTIATIVYVPLTFQEGPPAWKLALKLSSCLTAAGVDPNEACRGLEMVIVTAVAVEGAMPVTKIVALPV